MNPLTIFKNWYEEELSVATVSIPSACCLSTIGMDGFPNARFVSLKEITETSFIITGPVTSRKGLEIAQSNKIALTCWWAATERQVRIQGEAERITDADADKYFAERPEDARIVSLVSRQGEILENAEQLNEKYERLKLLLNDKKIERPDDWGGYSIHPKRIEFMEFKSTRFHERMLYELNNDEWIVKRLQP